MKKLYSAILFFAGGLVCGAVLTIAAGVFASRAGGAPGGEIFLPIGLVVLPCVGYWLRQLVEPAREQRPAIAKHTRPVVEPERTARKAYDWSESC